jgi:hypothetical protein
MPDVFQQRDDAGGVLTDLSPASFDPWYLERGSFTYAPGQVTRVEVEQPRELGGGALVIRERRTNDRVGATWTVLGADQSECWLNARDLVTAFSRQSGMVAAGLADLRLWWRPEGVDPADGWLMRQQGSADWTFAYAWAPLTMGAAAGQAVLQLSASWAVLPFTWEA